METLSLEPCVPHPNFIPRVSPQTDIQIDLFTHLPLNPYPQNQLGAETEGPFTSDPKSNRNALDAHQSGTSTPAYAEEDGKSSGS